MPAPPSADVSSISTPKPTPDQVLDSNAKSNNKLGK